MVGSRVQSQWTVEEGGNGEWFSGRVEACYANGDCKVKFDDGDSWSGPGRYVRLLDAQPPQASPYGVPGYGQQPQQPSPYGVPGYGQQPQQPSPYGVPGYGQNYGQQPVMMGQPGVPMQGQPMAMGQPAVAMPGQPMMMGQPAVPMAGQPVVVQGTFA